MQTHWNTAIHRDGYLYGSSGRHETAVLRCIDMKTGQVKWDQPDLSRSSLLYVDNHFVCLTEYGDLLLVRVNSDKFDLVGHRKLTRPRAANDFEPRDPYWAAPILSHGLLYIRGDDRLVCMELIPEQKN
jgi:hypothetical protein